MRTIFLISFLIFNIFHSQERLAFVKDEGIKKEIQNSIEFLDKSKEIPNEVKNKLIFITFDIDQLPETEELGFNYSTTIPLAWADIDVNGQFISKFIEKNHDEWMFYNYSSQIVLVFRGSLEYFNVKKMRRLSKMIHIKESNIIKSEYFAFNKGYESSQDFPENNISMKRINGKYIPVYANTFDLKTFLEVWYGLNVNEIPVSKTNNLP